MRVKSALEIFSPFTVATRSGTPDKSGFGALASVPGEAGADSLVDGLASGSADPLHAVTNDNEAIRTMDAIHFLFTVHSRCLDNPWNTNRYS